MCQWWRKWARPSFGSPWLGWHGPWSRRKQGKDSKQNIGSLLTTSARFDHASSDHGQWCFSVGSCENSLPAFKKHTFSVYFWPTAHNQHQSLFRHSTQISDQRLKLGNTRPNFSFLPSLLVWQGCKWFTFAQKEWEKVGHWLSKVSDKNRMSCIISRESRLMGEISITSDMQMTPPLWQKKKN